MPKSPIVSIVLPTFNGSRYLSQAIESCLAQTFADFELIIVDDCSTDSTPIIIREYLSRDSRVTSIRNDHNVKLPRSLNAGFRAAKGQYYCWISDDNLYLPEALGTMVEFLDSRPQCDVVYADYILVDGDGNRLRSVRVDEPESLVVRNGIGPCWLYRSTVHTLLNGYDEATFLAEDYDFFLRAFCNVGMAPIHKPIYEYRVHGESLTATRAVDVSRTRDAVKRKNIEAIRHRDRRLASLTYISLIDGALTNSDGSAARRYAIGALLCSPLTAFRSAPKRCVAGLLGPPATRTLARILCAARSPDVG